MSKLSTPLLICLLLAYGYTSRAQSFLNGDFENTTTIGDQINMTNAGFNAAVPYDTSFGTYGDLDMITSTAYGGLAQHGNWYTALTGGGTDQLSMALSTPLVAGQNYTISFYDRGYTYATYPFVIGLSTTSTSLGATIYTTPAGATPYVWTQRQFTFTAPNNGRFITVTMTCCGTGDSWSQVDNFSFVCGGLNLGPDTSICSGNSYVINATGANATSYLWQDGSTDSMYTAGNPGLYWLQATYPACVVRDSVVLSTVSAPVVNLGNDTTLCTGASLLLDAGNAGATYQWQDLSGNQTLSAGQSGVYWVKVSSNGCSASDTIILNFSNGVTLNLGNDTTICPYDSVVLNATLANATYQWQDGSVNPTYTATQAGNYSVTVSVSGCTGTDSVQVSRHTLAALIASSALDTICPGDSTSICATTGFATYLWNTGSGTNCLFATQSGSYYVIATDNNTCTEQSNNVVIDAYPVSSIIISQNGDTLRVVNSGAVQWYRNGTAVNGAISPIFIALQSGNYSVSVKSSYGCTAFSTLIMITGIEKIENDELSIFPNPLSSGNWQLEAGSDLLGSVITIYDDNARMVYQAPLNSIHSEIDLNVAQGLYLLRICSSRGMVVRKLVKL